jgi:NADH:ubiquinone oxidoreductase subunit 4 (subunit M)
MMIPIVAMCIFMGVAPAIFLRPMEPAVARVVQLIHGVGR